jgi:hypothetical protein
MRKRMVEDIQRPIVFVEDELEVVVVCGVVDSNGDQIRRSTPEQSHRDAGLGVQEVALSGALVGFGAHNAAAVAATLLYRSLTFLPSVVLGLASAATYNLGKPRLTTATATVED